MLEPRDEVFAAPEGARRCARRHIAQHGRGFVQRGAIVLVQRFVYELFLDIRGNRCGGFVRFATRGGFQARTNEKAFGYA